VRDVLHLTVGEQLVLLDNSGDELVCAIVTTGRSAVEVEVLEHRAGKRESPVHIVLCQGLLKSTARFEWLLEKGTELGVSTFMPVVCHRSTAGLESAGSAKIQRWQRIIQEAAEQCDRARLPELLPIRPLTQALENIPAGTLAIMAWEEAQAVSLHNVLHQAIHSDTSQSMSGMMTVMLFIGPEGGLATEEVMLAQRHGVQVVTLGRRILRAETAALTAIANVMYEFETGLVSSS
jgi:16S rRNA (uracil1498-N3)-methyltransferase